MTLSGASESITGADTHEMHLVAEFSSRAILAGQRDATIIGVEIFAASDKMLGEGILDAGACDQPGLDLFVPDHLLHGVTALLHRMAIAIADAGHADTDAAVNARIKPGPVVLRRREVRNTDFSSLRRRSCQ